MTDKHATVKAQVTEGGASVHATNGAAAADDARAPSKTRRGHPHRARRGLGRHGRGLGRDAGDRPRPGLPDGPPGAAHRTRGPRGARAEPPRREPGPRRGRIVGDRRARPGAAPGRASRAGGHRLSRGRRPLAVVRPGHRRAQGPRGRPDRRRPRGEGARSRGGARARTPTTRSSPRCANGCRPSSSSSACSIARSGSCRSSSRASSSGRSSCSDGSRTRRSSACSICSAGSPDQDVIDLVEALSRLSPTAARRATKLMSGVVRTVVALASGHDRTTRRPATRPRLRHPDDPDGMLRGRGRASDSRARSSTGWPRPAPTPRRTSSRSGAPGSATAGTSRAARRAGSATCARTRRWRSTSRSATRSSSSRARRPSWSRPAPPLGDAILAGYAKYKAAEGYEASAGPLDAGRAVGAAPGQGLRLVGLPRRHDALPLRRGMTKPRA